MNTAISEQEFIVVAFVAWSAVDVHDDFVGALSTTYYCSVTEEEK
jgi:hypothetical protein